VYATAAIAFSVHSWSGLTTCSPLASADRELFFHVATLLIAVPHRGQVFNWVSTNVPEVPLTFEAPHAVRGGLRDPVTIGALRLMLASPRRTSSITNTLLRRSALHYVLVPGATFGKLASAY